MSEKKANTSASSKVSRTRYKALVGMNYGDKRVEPGEVVDDIPEADIEWLLEQNCIKEVD